jgi:putative ABC transport system ATP-binding protein
LKEGEEMKTVEISNLHKSYMTGKLETKVLMDLTMSADPGEMIMIMGPSGCGKTTLLNLLGGIDKPNSGSINVAGHQLDGLSAKELNKFRRTEVGFIFQFYNLIPTLTALENVMLGIETVITDKKEMRTRAEKYLELVGLADKMDNLPQEMSAGEQQRVAIARALAKEPKLILADEPTGNLDEDRGEKIMELMQKLQKELNMTFLIVSHNSDLKRFANRTLILRRGKLNPT